MVCSILGFVLSQLKAAPPNLRLVIDVGRVGGLALGLTGWGWGTPGGRAGRRSRPRRPGLACRPPKRQPWNPEEARTSRGQPDPHRAPHRHRRGAPHRHRRGAPHAGQPTANSDAFPIDPLLKGALCSEAIRLESFRYSKRQNSSSKLAQEPEQSEFTHSADLVAAGHLQKRTPSETATPSPTLFVLVQVLRGALCPLAAQGRRRSSARFWRLGRRLV